MTDRATGFALLDEAASDVLQLPDVDRHRMFASEGYAVRSKVFAFVSSDGRLVVKLPADRIGELDLDNMVMRGSEMREWAVVDQSAGAERWRAIFDEALAFVDSITPKA